MQTISDQAYNVSLFVMSDCRLFRLHFQTITTAQLTTKNTYLIDMPTTNSLAALLVRSRDLTFVKLFDMYNYASLTSVQADDILQQNICGISRQKPEYQVQAP